MDEQTRARLEAERAEAYTAMRSVLDAVDAENGGMTAEQAGEYDAAESRFDQLDKTLKAEARQRDRDRSGGILGNRSDDPERDAADRAETRSERFERALDLAQRSEANRVSFVQSGEYREAFVEGLLRRGLMGAEMAPEYRAALNLAVDAEGGFTAPEEFVRELLKDQADFATVRAHARVISTGHGRDLEFPVLATKGTAGWTQEVPTTPDSHKSEPTFGAPKVVKAHPAQREVVTSKDLLQDSVFNIESLIRELIAESFGELEGEAFWTGDGNGKPSGIIPNLDAANVVTGAAGQVNTVTSDELIDVQHSIKRRHRANARWFLNDQSVKAVRKLRDGDGNMIWQPGLTDGEPGRILGKPYEVDEYVPDMAASATSIVYGDASGYMVRDVLALGIQRLVETYARTRQVGFLADKRVDGVLLRPERLAAYKHPAA